MVVFLDTSVNDLASFPDPGRNGLNEQKAYSATNRTGCVVHRISRLNKP